MNQFPIFVNLKERKILLLGSGEMADAKRRLYKRTGAEITDDETAENIALAVVALDDDTEAEKAVVRLKKAGFLVNAVDRSHLCDYTTPAIVDRDPVLIAIGTGGASAGLAKALRQRLERIFPENLGQLAKSLLAAKSRIASIWPKSPDRRRAIDAVLEPGAVLDPESANAAENIDKWLENPSTIHENRVVEISLSSDDPDDLTIKQARMMGQADMVFADPAVPQNILIRARADAVHFDLSEFAAEKTEGLILLIRTKS